MRRVRLSPLLLFAAAAACAPQPVPVVVEAAPPPAAPPPPPAPMPQPQPPVGAAPNLTIPARTVDGLYQTPVRGLATPEAVWNVRSALNVAALGCPAQPQLVDQYNALLARQKATLATADTETKNIYRARFGRTWQDAHDDQQTRAYNFWAQSPARADFCVAAAAIMAEAQTVPPSAFQGFALAALERLEAPFTTFYRNYDNYRNRLAAWTDEQRLRQQREAEAYRLAVEAYEQQYGVAAAPTDPAADPNLAQPAAEQPQGPALPYVSPATTGE